jgi:uncharacterized protein (TIGR02444 family)
MSAALDLDGPHWAFALALYARPGVAPACLRLQDELGVDVNVLLIALFAAAERGIAVGGEEVAALDAAIARWRERVVAPLRSVRRDLKTEFPAAGAEGQTLREGVKALELEAEKVEQAMLARALDGLPRQGQADVEAAIFAVAAFYAGKLISTEAAEALHVLRDAVLADRSSA